jgi:polyprenyl P-hydroxybenzoate/phenylacrylic acid decarboxylase-like protein
VVDTPEPPLTDEELRAFRAWMATRQQTRRIILGITGASAPILGVRTLEVLAKQPGIETHLVVSDGAKQVMHHEMGFSETDFVRFIKLADVVYDNRDMAASISSGSFQTDGMIVSPCSMKTLADIALSRDESLIARAAICCLKEGRQVVLVPRETPATLSYLRNLVTAAENGARILLPVPATYHGPHTIDDVMNHIVQKTLDQFGIEANLFRRWHSPTGE